MNGNNCIGPFILIIPIMFVLLFFVVGWVAYALVWGVSNAVAAASTRAPVPLSLEIAERVVRLQLVRYAAACTLALAGMVATLMWGLADWSAMLAVVSMFLMRVVSRRREALQRLARPGATAHRRNNWLLVTDTSAQTKLPVSKRTFRAGERAILPVAIAERQALKI